MALSLDAFFVLTCFDNEEAWARAFQALHNKKWVRNVGADIHSEPLLGHQEQHALKVATKERPTKPEVFVRLHEQQLVVDFGQLQPSVEGVRFGTDDESCEVHLPVSRGEVSPQYNIVIDAQHRVWLEDSRSTCGTAVFYNTGKALSAVRKGIQASLERRQKWLLANSPVEAQLSEHVYVRSGSFGFGITFPNHHNLENKVYKDHLGKFSNSKPVQAGFTSLAGGLEAAVLKPSKYLKIDCIGTGAYGVVNKCIGLGSHEVVAVKKLQHCDPTDPPRSPAALKREYDYMIKFPHCNIAEVIQFIDGPKPKIVMRYYPDGNVHDFAKRAQLGRSDYVTITAQVLSALQYLHENGLTHRDLKPGNILISSDPHLCAKVCDFGLAKEDETGAGYSSIVGTKGYIAPEVSRGKDKGYTCAIDVWSLGVMVYEWIHGFPSWLKSLLRELRKSTDRLNFAKVNDAFARELEQMALRLNDHPLNCILQALLKFNPYLRWPASACLKFGLSTDLFEKHEESGMYIHGPRELPTVSPSVTYRVPSASFTTIRPSSKRKLDGQEAAGENEPDATIKAKRQRLNSPTREATTPDPTGSSRSQATAEVAESEQAIDPALALPSPAVTERH